MVVVIWMWLRPGKDKDGDWANHLVLQATIIQPFDKVNTVQLLISTPIHHREPISSSQSIVRGVFF